MTRFVTPVSRQTSARVSAAIGRRRGNDVGDDDEQYRGRERGERVDAAKPSDHAAGCGRPKRAPRRRGSRASTVATIAHESILSTTSTLILAMNAADSSGK